MLVASEGGLDQLRAAKLGRERAQRPLPPGAANPWRIRPGHSLPGTRRRRSRIGYAQARRCWPVLKVAAPFDSIGGSHHLLQALEFSTSLHSADKPGKVQE
mmetsp:Transcript_58872/g.182424  ORF Transcript_58872/g.182424 Transcript_58872/m.182424 type:complete len:101 (-) Transcript_58872:34-336(-)